MQDNSRYCTSCKTKVSKDLSFCPLCGKYLLEENEKIETNGATFPNYDYTYIRRGRWIKTVRNTFVTLALIVLLINLMFSPKVLYFPYVWTSLVYVFFVCIEPFKNKTIYLKFLVRVALLTSLFLIFIDYYDHITLKTDFGWSLSIVAPSVLTGFSVLIGLLALFNKKFEIMHFYGSFMMVIVAIFYYLINIIFFREFVDWAILMFLCASVISVLLLFTFKNKIIMKDVKKKFHV